MQTVHIIAASHGTDSQIGQAQINELREQIATTFPVPDGVDLRWHEAYVDVQQPRLPEVLDALPREEAVVLVPLLVADGFHTTEDFAQAAASHPRAVVAGVLATGTELVRVLADRAAAHLEQAETVVLAAAGTRMRIGQEQIQTLAQRLGEELNREVAVAYCAGAKPEAGEVVRAATGEKVLLLSVLLAEGYFQNKLRSTEAWVVTSPLLPDANIAQCFAERAQQALVEVLLDDEK
ncbi:CbiX/SirB N-terminal domain-containing protein [Glutamicibacter sp. PS]|uniref:sirohydrochlorin chelatase n=1 Tax=Glutamicibacter sp. PS TaxID=3075634 RepID=UPI002841B654|nr:CbiX/SirB N-terminal domain-containing protein [Glutamicibacter sp. PS]MDR4532608.1 hypothetical protein [Glutamicibacter sp. PS]